MERPGFISAPSLHARKTQRRSISSRRSTVALAGASTLIRQLNDSHVRELAGLVIRFGSGPYSWEALTSVQAIQLNETGLQIECVMCDGPGCVCACENIDWPQGRVADVEGAISALRELVDSAGLDGAVLSGLETSTSAVLRG